MTTYLRDTRIKELAKRLKELKNEDGLTLKEYAPIQYKSGYEVATEGHTLKTVEDALKAIVSYEGNCGVWLENNIYYIDKSHRITLKRDAIKEGRDKEQLSILQWKGMKLIYL